MTIDCSLNYMPIKVGLPAGSLSPVIVALLGLVVLESGGKAVYPKEYAWSGTRKVSDSHVQKGGVKYENIRAYAYSEPRIRLIERVLAFLITYGTFLYEGRPVLVDGFRLAPLSRWRTMSRVTLPVALGPLSPVCNLKCKFCYEAGNTLVLDRTTISLDEALTRIRYYDTENKCALPVPLRAGLEDFCNPHTLEIYTAAQKRLTTLINITTNGSRLTGAMVERMKAIKPVLVCISLNSLDPDRRRTVMGDRKPSIAIGAPSLLCKAGIPFIGSIVPWHPFDLQDLEYTIRFLDEQEALSIRVCLPGYSRFYSETPLFDLDSVWRRIVDAIYTVRGKVRCPVIPTPAQFGSYAIEAEIDGVYYRSPAWYAGLRTYDVILSVNGKEVFTRRDAEVLIAQGVDEGKIHLVVRRGSQEYPVEFESTGDYGDVPAQANYPYWPEGYPAPVADVTGLLFIGDLWKDDIAQIRAIVDSYSAHSVLLLSTILMRKNLIRLLKMLEFVGDTTLDGIELRIAITKHEFWGGNIIVGDLNMVTDFISTIRDILDHTDYRPELILIPSSFANQWGFDLQGRSFREIEAATGIPVERIMVRRIYQ